ncbi:MAG: DUF6288 domain-containing protein [Planctomycetes bacterium]|nr:DUF6288 domain-containing protein [Planctomycetota bacterium]
MPRVLPFALALTAALAGAPCPAPTARAETGTSDWPFGAQGGARWGGRQRDLYNLGILGAKARDPDRSEPAAEQSGKRSFKMDGDGKAEDEGPDKLKVELLFPDGPASKAGLHVGDVITGVNGRKFKDGSLAPIARAILDAESGKVKGGIVKLNVERAGEKDPLAIDVVVTVVGKDAATPTVGKMRDQMLTAAAEWLAKRQQDDGGFPQTLSGENGAVCATSVAGLVWLAAGSDLTKGPYAERLRNAATFVGSTAGVDSMSAPAGESNWSQVNWGLAHAGIFLGELQARSPDAAVSESLRKCGESLAKNQEKSGGWAHGPGGPNGLGYVELNIVTGLALCGLGMAQRSGFEPPADVLKRAEDYLVASSGGDGGVGYSTSPGQVGQGNIGRSAIAWLGTLTLGQRNAPYAKKMENYVRQHAGEVFGGHASLMEHYLFAGVAAHAQGGEALTKYWAVCERDLVLARSPDGSFQPRPWHESITMQSNSDVSFGEVWTTGAWAVVIGCEPVKGGRPGLPAWMGKLPPPLPPKKK